MTCCECGDMIRVVEWAPGRAFPVGEGYCFECWRRGLLGFMEAYQQWVRSRYE